MIRIGVVLSAVLFAALCLEVGQKMSIPGIYGMVSPVQAEVGRPASPKSVAGVHRRQERRGH